MALAAMQVTKLQVLNVKADDDVVKVRKLVREFSGAIGLSLVDQTKIVTAASELARNTIVYGGGGTAQIELVANNSRGGVRVTFEDKGPGIPNIETAMRDGFTTGTGLGLGLGGAKRLSNEFEITSAPNQGTRVSITRWKY